MEHSRRGADGSLPGARSGRTLTRRRAFARRSIGHTGHSPGRRPRAMALDPPLRPKLLSRHPHVRHRAWAREAPTAFGPPPIHGVGRSPRRPPWPQPVRDGGSFAIGHSPRVTGAPQARPLRDPSRSREPHCLATLHSPPGCTPGRATPAGPRWGAGWPRSDATAAAPPSWPVSHPDAPAGLRVADSRHGRRSPRGRLRRDQLGTMAARDRVGSFAAGSGRHPVPPS